MKVLLLGSTGFIGSAIFAELMLREIPFETITRQEWDLNDLNQDPPLYSDITHIVNAAGCTNFALVDQNWSSNFYSPIKLFDLYQDIPILHFGTSWVNYTDKFQTPYLKAKQALEAFVEARFHNVTILRPSIVTGHTWYEYLPRDKFFGFGIHCAKSGCYKDIEDKKWDLIPVDWIASTCVDMLQRPKLKYRKYNFSQGPTSQTLKDLFDCYKDVELVGELDRAYKLKVNKAVKVYRPYLEQEAIFDNNNLWFDNFDLPPSVIDINQAFVDKLNPKTILLKGEL